MGGGLCNRSLSSTSKIWEKKNKLCLFPCMEIIAYMIVVINIIVLSILRRPRPVLAERCNSWGPMCVGLQRSALRWRRTQPWTPTTMSAFSAWWSPRLFSTPASCTATSTRSVPAPCRSFSDLTPQDRRKWEWVFLSGVCVCVCVNVDVAVGKCVWLCLSVCLSVCAYVCVCVSTVSFYILIAVCF